MTVKRVVDGLRKINYFIKSNKLKYLLFFSLIFIILLLVAFPPNLICPDGFFHTKMAVLIKERGIIKNFPWMFFTTYRENFVNQHFGYHLFLIPFLFLPSPKNLDTFSREIEPLIKTKLATVFLASLIFLIIYWFLKKERVKGAFFYSLLLLLIYPFLIRITFTRAPAISIIILLFGIYLIIKQKYGWMTLLSFIYVWTYGGWPLILLATLIYCLGGAIKNIIDQWPELQKTKNEKLKSFNPYIVVFNFTLLPFNFIRHFFSKTNLKLLFACILGLALGLTINPYFPKTFAFHWFEVVKIAIINYHNKIGVGAEWYPLELRDLILTSLPILILWIVASAWFISQAKNQSKNNYFLFLFSLFFLLYTLKARRNIEYFAPIAIIFNALSLKSYWQSINWQEYFLKLKKFFRPSTHGLGSFILGLFLAVMTIFFFGYFLSNGLFKLGSSFERGPPFTYFQKASYWLKNNTQPQEIIYQSSWDIFPMLFYFNDQNYYINGLDQTFMYEHDQKLYKKWENIFYGKANPKELAKIIKEDFQSSFVLLENKTWKTEKMLRLFKKSPDFEKVYEDEEATILKIKSATH